MIYPVHQIPGRLRIKSPLIKGKPHQAETLRSHLQGIVGVVTVTVSSVTGSAIIEYAQDVVTIPGILHELDSLGYPLGRGGEGDPRPAASASPFEHWGEKILESVAQAVIERSALALASALI